MFFTQGLLKSVRKQVNVQTHGLLTVMFFARRLLLICFSFTEFSPICPSARGFSPIGFSPKSFSDFSLICFSPRDFSKCWKETFQSVGKQVHVQMYIQTHTHIYIYIKKGQQSGSTEQYSVGGTFCLVTIGSSVLSQYVYIYIYTYISIYILIFAYVYPLK